MHPLVGTGQIEHGEIAGRDNVPEGDCGGTAADRDQVAKDPVESRAVNLEDTISHLPSAFRTESGGNKKQSDQRIRRRPEILQHIPHVQLGTAMPTSCRIYWDTGSSPAIESSGWRTTARRALLVPAVRTRHFA